MYSNVLYFMSACLHPYYVFFYTETQKLIIKDAASVVFIIIQCFDSKLSLSVEGPRSNLWIMSGKMEQREPHTRGVFPYKYTVNRKDTLFVFLILP